jgi:hypothetical protein
MAIAVDIGRENIKQNINTVGNIPASPLDSLRGIKDSDTKVAACDLGSRISVANALQRE